MALIPHTKGGDQGTDPDPGCPQVVDLINFQYRIDLSGMGKDIRYLVCGNGVKAAAKGV